MTHILTEKFFTKTIYEEVIVFQTFLKDNEKKIKIIYNNTIEYINLSFLLTEVKKVKKKYFDLLNFRVNSNHIRAVTRKIKSWFNQKIREQKVIKYQKQKFFVPKYK